MNPKLALAKLLAQHAELRGIVDRCEDLADSLDAGRIEPAEVVPELTRLRLVFKEHNHFEEEFLHLLLGEVAEPGEALAEHAVAFHIGEHRRMHEGLVFGVSGELRATLERMREHLAAEERYFLASNVLRR